MASSCCNLSPRGREVRLSGARLTLAVAGRREASDSVAKVGWSSSFLSSDASFRLDSTEQPSHNAKQLGTLESPQPIPRSPPQPSAGAQLESAQPRLPHVQAMSAGQQSPPRPVSTRDANLNERVDPSNLTAARLVAEACPHPARPQQE